MNDISKFLLTVTKMLRNGSVSPLEVIRSSAEAIRKHDGLLNSFLSTDPNVMDPDRQEMIVNERDRIPGALFPIPFAVKDLFFTSALPTTCGSKAPIPESVGSPVQGLAVNRLVEAGAVLVGKNNLHEYAFGITNENDHFGPVRNPWDPSRMSGGSSGGSAAAVAAGLVPFSIGTDTRGSIRIPSACCGVTGLKPTFGRIPVSGVVPLSRSLDHVGPITRDVADAELVFSIMKGEPINIRVLESKENRDPRVMKIGVCDYYFTRLNQEVSSSVHSALGFFKGQGMEIREVRMPILDDALEASDIVSRAEGYSLHRKNLQMYPGGYGEPVARRLGSGRELSAVDLVEAFEVKEQVTREFQEVFNEVDCILAPTLPVTAPLLGTSELDIEGWKEPIVHGFVRFNAPQNMAGVPCLTLPCGFDSAGLPIGLQLISGHNREDVLFALGKLYQSETGK